MTPLFALLLSTLDERLRLRQPARKTLNKVFPHHWSFLLGEVALFSLVMLVLTGIFLTMFYRPSTDLVVYTGSSALYHGQSLPAAFESIVRLTYDVNGGLLFRRIHRGAAHLFIASIILHLLRVVLTGAFRRPRELNYHLGLVLLLLAFALGFTGYSLPFDSLAGTGIRVAYSELLSFPLVGDRLAFWIFGGPFPTGDVIPRFFVFHVLLLPAIIGLLIAGHLGIVARQRHTQFPRFGIDGHRWVYGKPLWPWQFAESTTLVLWLGGVLAASALLVPWADVTLLGPYRPGIVGNNAQPDWYLFWVEGALRIFPPLEWDLPGVTIAGTFVAGVLLPGIVVAGLAAYPFIERKVYDLRGDWHVLSNPLEIPLRAGAAMGFFSFLLVLSAAATNDILSLMTGIPVETITVIFRVAALAVPTALTVAVVAYSRRRLRARGLEVGSSEAGPRRAGDPAP
ncbi:MAG TPA: cytochrome b N-terminal domain-containing protein [Egibacteraceae bacterium]|nr:cytochrome b N-terminal domain-containing protein [Egibacteraceae bacterium]